MRARVGDSAPTGRSGPVADFVEAAAGASPTAVTDTLTLDLTASFQRRSLSRCTVEGTVENSDVCEAEHTRISSAKLLSSPSRALTASKSNTNCARQQASVLLGQMRIPWAGKGGSTCGSVASALSSGAFSVVRTRPAGKTNKVAADRRARVRAERRTWRAHLARRRDEIPASVLLSRAVPARA